MDDEAIAAALSYGACAVARFRPDGHVRSLRAEGDSGGQPPHSVSGHGSPRLDCRDGERLQVILGGHSRQAIPTRLPRHPRDGR